MNPICFPYPVDSDNKGHIRQHVQQDRSGDHEREPVSLGERAKSIHGRVIVCVSSVYDDRAPSHRFVVFGHTYLAEGIQNWDRHDKGRKKVFGGTARAMYTDNTERAIVEEAKVKNGKYITNIREKKRRKWLLRDERGG